MPSYHRPERHHCPKPIQNRRTVEQRLTDDLAAYDDTGD